MNRNLTDIFNDMNEMHTELEKTLDEGRDVATADLVRKVANIAEAVKDMATEVEAIQWSIEQGE